MSVIAGPDPFAPVSVQEDPAVFAGKLDWDPKAGRPDGSSPSPRPSPAGRGVRRDRPRRSKQGRGNQRPYSRPVRVAWSRDLGRYPIDPAVTQVVDAQRKTFESLGCEVEDAAPDLLDADEIFQVYRAYAYAQQHERHLREHRDLMKETVVWNTEQGLKLTALDMARAEEKRTRLYGRAVEFFDKYDFLVLPTTSVPPFSVEQEYVAEINGVKLKTYIDWFAICYAISVTGFPAISAPAGFTEVSTHPGRPSPRPSPTGRGIDATSRPSPAGRGIDLTGGPSTLRQAQGDGASGTAGSLSPSSGGLPLGLQIVGGPMQDWPVLQMAYAYEQATRFGERRPAVAL